MKFHLIKSVTVAVERAKLRGEFVGIETKLDGFRLAERRAQFRQFPFGPARRLAPNGLAQCTVARKQVVRLERRRLVLDLEHGRKVSGGEASIVSAHSGKQRTLYTPTRLAHGDD